MSLNKWAQGLVVWLLEVTHGQWLYMNMHVHEATTGMEATARREEIQHFIEDQLEMGDGGVGHEGSLSLLKINLEGLETSTGEDQHYWILQIKAARYKLALQRQNNESNSRNHREGERA